LVKTETSLVLTPVAEITGFAPPFVVMVISLVCVHVGVNSIGKVQLFPGATPAVQVLPVVRMVTFAPLLAALTVKFGIVPTLETVTSIVSVVPNETLPKLMEFVDTLTSVRALP
jgi:hypothetical protein